jgi:hypothetical protein
MHQLSNLTPFGTYGNPTFNNPLPWRPPNWEALRGSLTPNLDQVHQTLSNQLNVPADQWISRASYVNDFGGELVGLAFPEVAVYTRLLSPGYNGLQVVHTARDSYKQSGSIKQTLLETSDAALFQGIASVGLPLLISNKTRKYFKARLEKAKRPAWAAPHAGKLAVLLSAGLVAAMTVPVNALVGSLLNRYYRPLLNLEPKK